MRVTSLLLPGVVAFAGLPWVSAQTAIELGAGPLAAASVQPRTRPSSPASVPRPLRPVTRRDIADPVRASTEFTRSHTLGISEEEWRRVSIRGGLAYAEGDIRAYRLWDSFYYFRQGILVTVEPVLVPPAEVAAIDPARTRDPAVPPRPTWRRPRLGTTEAEWEPTSPIGIVVYAEESVTAYRRSRRFYHFHRGVLVEVGRRLVPAEEIRRAHATVAPAVPEPAPPPVFEKIYDLKGLRAYRTATEYHYYRDGRLVTVSSALLTAKEVAQREREDKKLNRTEQSHAAQTLSALDGMVQSGVLSRDDFSRTRAYLRDLKTRR